MKIGFAKTDITIFHKDSAFLGYGIYYNVCKGIETPIYARTMVVKEGERKIAFVCAEFCFSTVYLKKGVIAMLQEKYPDYGYSDENVMITAQHTHSTPGGYTQHFLYNLLQTGFQQEVYECYRDGIVKSVILADDRCRDGSLKLSSGDFSLEQDVAFNRSMKSYNRNPEVTQKRTDQEAHLAVDRTMHLLRANDNNGVPLGVLNWFGVHTTSVSNDNTKICSDNKGYAAHYFEKLLNGTENPENQEIITLFAQEAAGDVTPNYVWDKKKKWTRGPFEDDIESARYHGNMQFEKAKEIFDKADSAGKFLNGEIDYIQAYIDMSDVACDPKYTDGQEGKHTGGACLGISFLQGTKEGPGAPDALGYLVKFIYPFIKTYELGITKFWKSKEEIGRMKHKYETHHPKYIVMDCDNGRVLTAKYTQRLFVPAFTDPVIKYMKAVGREGVTAQRPWISTVLPLQIFTIGELALIGIPAEITTIAGRRLRNLMLEKLAAKGITQVILCPYANGYAGYITTPEEYEQQAYEGGHTLFGKWTLPAYQTCFARLAEEICKPKNERQNIGQEPIIFPPDKLWRGFKNEKIRVKV